MNFDLYKSTILLVLTGSRGYGTNHDASDWDYRGIAIPPLDSYIGIKPRFQQCVDGEGGKHVWKHYPEGLVQPDADMQVMELCKFATLATDCNPSIIEILFSDDSKYVYKHPVAEMLLDKREMFLSKRAKARFCGYALSQLNRIKRHKRWYDDPPTSAPTREEFGLPGHGIISPDQIGAAEAMIQKEVDEFMIAQDDLPEHTKIELTNGLGRMMRAVWIALQDTEYPVGEGKAFTSTEEALMMAVMKKEGYSDNFILVLTKEKKYRAAQKEWESYLRWKKERNVDRAALEQKFGYDCYLDDTEFLTKNGWLRYDEIDDATALATMNKKTGELEFQLPTERVSKKYHGPILFIETQDTACAVTPNHRMWVSPVRGGTANKKGTSYSEEQSYWKIVKAESLSSDRRYSYHCRTAPLSNGNEFRIEREELVIVGAYVSEGCVQKHLTNGIASVIKISQKLGGRLQPFMDYFSDNCIDEWKPRKYEYLRKNGRKKEITEVIWTIANVELANNLASNCGEGSETKRLPKWYTSLSKEDAKFLLDVLISGDGTERKFSRIYYTKSKQLADDVQVLAMIAGFTSKIWGPYPYGPKDDNMYQVYIGKNGISRIITKGNDSHIKTENVDGKIVCFTVPNEILVTRRKGKIAIQGNTKHGMHLVRLLRMAREIIETGKVLVNRPDAEELKEIRAGAWTYERMVDFAEGEDKALAESMKKSPLRAHPDSEVIHDLIYKMVMEFNR